jgi:ribosome-associated protein
MTHKNLKQTLLAILDDMQAIDIKIIDVHQQTTITDDMIICSGRASRHVSAIASEVLEQMKAKGFKSLHNTGLEGGEWALIDFGDLILHVMLPEVRTYYDLESLWSGQA